MRRSSAIAVVIAAGVLGTWCGLDIVAAPAKEPMIGHMVYFQLRDNSPAAVGKMVAGCDKYLKGHPGEVYYAAGTLAKDFTRPINDRDWDAALHLVFKSKADHDKYQTSTRHQQFIAEAQEGIKKVRVFDSLIESK